MCIFMFFSSCALFKFCSSAGHRLYLHVLSRWAFSFVVLGAGELPVYEVLHVVSAAKRGGVVLHLALAGSHSRIFSTVCMCLARVCGVCVGGGGIGGIGART